MPRILAVDHCDRSARGADSRMELRAPAVRRMLDRRQMGDRRDVFRGGRRATDTASNTLVGRGPAAPPT
jgi:hypothetical protein